jgi:hypothetical protein
MVMEEVEVIAEVRVIVRGTMGTEDPMGCGVSTVTVGVPDTISGYSVTVLTVVLPPTKPVKVMVTAVGTELLDELDTSS